MKADPQILGLSLKSIDKGALVESIREKEAQGWECITPIREKGLYFNAKMICRRQQLWNKETAQ
ncbi:hypothetical protein [Shouchella lonarensis]|uniref:DUF4177 domain-containing protein n=1 Tax=Shouchella lonarensis TaxID=1464122 RepID=A0A1G6ILW5_9BACI|nr:hypothetical protein [Shouchella lonarensis]SDC07433.1 hypothetical protein SAMN05421737_105106 [Shouchella lonarensis]